jgi:hypothetical protein
MSNKYNAIMGWIQAEMTFTASYKNQDRTLCPHVLGYKFENDEAEANERVLCYQVSGPAPAQGWRCFDVGGLTIYGPDPQTPFQKGPNYAGRRWQASVKNPKFEVPI